MALLSPVTIGCAGLGGYAKTIREMIVSEEEGEAPSLKLMVACEPDHEPYADVITDLRHRGVKVYRDFQELFAEPVEAVWLPLPIHLHRRCTEAALAAGKAVMSEKPAAGAVQDVDAMIAARDRAGLPVAVGFQDIYQPETLAIKRKLLAGALGKIRSGVIHACWPRDESYFKRSAWAGKLKVGETWVLDSPAQNALSHFINLALFFLGGTFPEGAEAAAVEAELYRVNPIESYDTCSLRVTTAEGASLLILLTHASVETIHPEITLHGEAGTLHYCAFHKAVFRTAAGEESLSLRQNSLAHMARRFAALVRGVEQETPIATLEMARTPVRIINGASEVAAIQEIEPVIRGVSGRRLHIIPGIENLFAHCAREQVMLHESRLAEWTRPAARRDLRGYSHFKGPAGNGD